MFGGFRVFTILVCSYGVSLIEGGNLGYQYPSPAAPVPPPSQPPGNYYAPVDYQPVINPNPEPTYSYYPSGPPAWDNVQWQPVESLPAWSYDDSSERVKPYYPSYQYAGPTTACPKKVPSTTTTTQRTTIPVIPITTTTLPPKVHVLHSLKLTKGLSAVLPATPAPTTLAPTTLAPTTPVPVTPRPAAHNHLRYHDHHKHHHNPDHYHHKHHYHHHHHGSAGSATVVQSTDVETLAPRINAVIRDLEEKVRELKLSFFKYGRLEDVNGRVDTVSPFAEKNEDPQEKEGETATDEGAKDSGRIEDLPTQPEHAEQQPETKATEELDPDNEESDMHPVDQNEGRLEANVHLQPEHRKVGELQGVVPWFNGVDIDLPRDLPLEDDYGYGNRATYGKNISPL